MQKKDLYFITGNKHKFEVAENFFKNCDAGNYFNLIQHDISPPEIQSDSIGTIATSSARWAFEKIGKPLITADAGLQIEALNGFPGPFVKYMNSWFNQNDLLRMMDGKLNRTAVFMDALAFVFGDMEEVFSSDTIGKLSTSPAKEDGYTVDQLFIPDGMDKSLVQLSNEERRDVWNVERWTLLTDFLIKNYDKL
ncbi:hypothetical protein HN358_02130 [Candidatus Uhrbacteria bacterium]|jgi:XTP/dITP diphosphohydrolase|nr:hypothetical protein [Candidatus Uhrbacteria bacterium]MBT7716902.1 hypothetical protein [Candidatus Uhrbacteria bacterium]